MQKNQPLSKYSTFGIGGEAKYFTEVRNIEELKKAFKFALRYNLPFHILGKGSNSLFSDLGFNGLVIHNKISFFEIENNIVSVGSGFNFSFLGSKTARLGLSGLEFASGIPATVGGAIFMNAGANGIETSDHLIEVGFVDANGKEHTYQKKDLEFSYRTSSFQKIKGAIVSAKFSLKPKASARKDQIDIVEYRNRTQPYGEKSCGCVFRNPKNESAGKLIEECGLKGLQVGGAKVSDLHANFIINEKNASAHDVLQLAKKIKGCVKDQTGIELELELREINPNEPI